MISNITKQKLRTRASLILLRYAPDKQTDKLTDLNILPTPTNRVGVGNYDLVSLTSHTKQRYLQKEANLLLLIAVLSQPSFRVKYNGLMHSIMCSPNSAAVTQRLGCFCREYITAIKQRMIQSERLATARLANNAHNFDARVSFTLQLVHKLSLTSHLRLMCVKH